MAKQMQNVSFTGVEEFLEFLPRDERIIVDILRELVFECIPNCTEKLAYNVPFYYVNKRICFIWPPAIQWGNVKMKGIEFGFTYGNLLRDESGYLEHGKRKQVYNKRFFRPGEIDTQILRYFLFEAAEIDLTFKKSRQ